MASVSSIKVAAMSKMAYSHDTVSGAQSWADTAHHKHNFSSALEGHCMAIEILAMVA